MGPRGQWNSPDSPPPTANDSPPPISSDSPVGSSRQVRPIPPLPVFDDPLAPPPAPEILDSPLSPGPAMEESSDDSPDFGLFDRSEEGPYPVEPEETPGFLESPVGSPPSAPRLAFRRLPPGAIGYEGPGPEVGPGLGFGIIESEEEDQFLASPLPRSRSREESGEDDHSDTDDCSTNEDDEEDEGYGDEDEEPLREFGHITGSCGNSGSDSESPEGLLPFGLAEELLGDVPAPQSQMIDSRCWANSRSMRRGKRKSSILCSKRELGI